MTSRTVSYSLELTDRTSSTVKSVTAAVQGLGTASSAATGQLSTSFNQTTTATDRLKVSVKETGNEYTLLRDKANAAAAVARQVAAEAANTERAANSLHSSSANVFEGFLKSQLVLEGLEAVKTGITGIIGDSIKLAGNFEQAQIGFKAMLGGNAEAANTMLAQLQALANVTPFTFEGEQQAARQLLAMGQTAEKVLPELHDIDTAVAAIGGTDVQVGQVTAALAKMGAEGKTSAVFMNELTRDGVPAWTMLAEEMGKSVSEVRALATQGSIASSVFDQAFHDYTVKHWGDALQAQSQTFQGLLSTASDFGQQLERVFGSGIIAELEPRLKGALDALQNPAVIATLHEWGVQAGQFLGYILDAASAVAQMFGMPAIAANTASAAQSANDFAGNWTRAVAPVESVKQQTKDLRNDTAQLRADAQSTTEAYAAQIAPLKEQEATIRANQAASTRGYDAQIAGLRDQAAVIQANAKASADQAADQIAPLREQLRLNQENITAAKTALDIKRLGEDIGADKGLAGDIFSSAGASARTRLLSENRQMEDLQARQRQEQTKTHLDNQIAAIEAVQRAAVEGFAAQSAANAAHVRGIEDAKRAEATQSAEALAGVAAQIAGIEKRKQAAADAYADAIAKNEAAIRAQGSADTAALAQTTARHEAANLAQGAAQVAAGVHAAEQSALSGFFAGSAISTAKRPDLMTSIFGTPAMQHDWGYALADNAIKGIGEAFHAWTGGKASPLMNMIMGGTSPADAMKNWLSQTAGIENLGGDLAKALFPENKGLFNDPNNLFGHVDDTPKTRQGLGQNDTKPTNPPPGRSWQTGHYIQEGGTWLWRDNDPTNTSGAAPTAPYVPEISAKAGVNVTIHAGAVIGTSTPDLAHILSAQIANIVRGR